MLILYSQNIQKGGQQQYDIQFVAKPNQLSNTLIHVRSVSLSALASLQYTTRKNTIARVLLQTEVGTFSRNTLYVQNCPGAKQITLTTSEKMSQTTTQICPENHKYSKTMKHGFINIFIEKYCMFWVLHWEKNQHLFTNNYFGRWWVLYLQVQIKNKSCGENCKLNEPIQV